MLKRHETKRRIVNIAQSTEVLHLNRVLLWGVGNLNFGEWMICMLLGARNAIKPARITWTIWVLLMSPANKAFG